MLDQAFLVEGGNDDGEVQHSKSVNPVCAIGIHYYPTLRQDSWRIIIREINFLVYAANARYKFGRKIDELETKMTHSIKPVKYPAAHALRIIDGDLAHELSIHRFDDRTRSKVQLFALGSSEGKQFAIVLGDRDAEAELHSRKQTRIILEPCTLPTLAGIKPYTEPYKGSAVRNSKLAAPNQVSCVVEDESALRELLRWYSARDQVPMILNRESLHEFRRCLQSPTGSTEAQRIVAQRVGQDIFRRALIEYWEARCAASGLNMVPLLRASHIKPWKVCENDEERLDVFNGLLLAPQLDALFDSGWITFSDDGEMVISDLLSIRQRKLLGVTENLNIRCLTDSHRNYLKYHRAECFERWKK